MAKGRGSASWNAAATAAAAVLLVVCVMLQTEYAQAATYTVGGAGGWTFNVANWPRGKRFRAGDVLVFNYNPTYHNVVAVNRAGYTGCRTPARAKTYRSGRDRITLSRGQNFFICNFPSHCQSGMKIAVTAI